MEADSIIIHGLVVSTHIGVPAEERASAQTLWVDLEITPPRAFATMEDEVAQTLDYQAMAEAVQRLAAAKERKLIETLAYEIQDLLLREFGALRVQVTVRKKILPYTDWVAVRTSDPGD
jgi:dihydroneopterin aldolase